MRENPLHSIGNLDFWVSPEKRESVSVEFGDERYVFFATRKVDVADELIEKLRDRGIDARTGVAVDLRRSKAKNVVVPYVVESTEIIGVFVPAEVYDELKKPFDYLELRRLRLCGGGGI